MGCHGAGGSGNTRGSRLACGDAGLFILGYCFYYYFARSEMSGFMQTAFYFGYMSMVRMPLNPLRSK